MKCKAPTNNFLKFWPNFLISPGSSTLHDSLLIIINHSYSSGVLILLQPFMLSVAPHLSPPHFMTACWWLLIILILQVFWSCCCHLSVAPTWLLPFHDSLLIMVNHCYSSVVLILLLPLIRRPHLAPPPFMTACWWLLFYMFLILLLSFIRSPHLSLPPGAWQLAKCLLCLSKLLGMTSKSILHEREREGLPFTWNLLVFWEIAPPPVSFTLHDSLLMIVNHSYSTGVIFLLLPFIRRPHLAPPPLHGSLLMIVNHSYCSGVLILLLPFTRRPPLSPPPFMTACWWLLIILILQVFWSCCCHLSAAPPPPVSTARFLAACWCC